MYTATFVHGCHEEPKERLGSHVQGRQELHRSPPGPNFPLPKLKATDQGRCSHLEVELKSLYNRL